MKKRTIVYILSAVLLGNFVLLTCSFLFFRVRDSRLSETEAVSILDGVLQTDGLRYLSEGDTTYMGEDAYQFRVYFDEGDYITTKGFYLVLKESKEVYMFNMYGEGYIRIV